MDKSLEKALEFANYMATLENQRRLLLEKFKENTIHYAHGGKFTVDSGFIGYVLSLDTSDTTHIVLDDNKIPVLIQDLEKFITDVKEIYHTALQNYYEEHEKLKKSRTVEKLIGSD